MARLDFLWDLFKLQRYILGVDLSAVYTNTFEWENYICSWFFWFPDSLTPNNDVQLNIHRYQCYRARYGCNVNKCINIFSTEIVERISIIVMYCFLLFLFKLSFCVKAWFVSNDKQWRTNGPITQQFCVSRAVSGFIYINYHWTSDLFDEEISKFLFQNICVWVSTFIFIGILLSYQSSKDFRRTNGVPFSWASLLVSCFCNWTNVKPFRRMPFNDFIQSWAYSIWFVFKQVDTN